MAITRSTLLTATHAGGTASGGNFATASISPTADKLITLVVVPTQYGGDTPPTSVTVSGNSLTWVEIGHSAAGYQENIWAFRAMGASPSSGAVTITLTGQSGATKACYYTIEEWTGIDTGGTNGSAAVPQYDANLAGSANPQVMAYSLAALADAGSSAVYSVTASESASSSDNSYTELFDNAPSSGDYYVAANWLVPGTTAHNVTATTTFQEQVGIAFEIKAGSAVSAPKRSLLLGVG